MIKKIDHTKNEIADQIFMVFQVSYQVEAKLLGVSQFPPLNRKPADFLKSNTGFFAHFLGDQMVGIIEILSSGAKIEICSLVVHPDYFRRGIATELINHVMGHNQTTYFIVETGSKNGPAMRLYQKLGFTVVGKWEMENGIVKVRLKRSQRAL